MTEAQAQNKLGELFVDIGVGGLGKTLKALNSVSASFLLTKNAAAQAFTPILNMTKEGASLATALSKISAETGLAGTKLLALKRFSDLNNVSLETLSGTLEGLQQKILGAKMGTDTASMQAFQLMNLNPFELSEKDPIKAFDEIKKRVETLSPEVQTMALNLLGMNKELTYVYKQIHGSLEDNLDNLEQEYKFSEQQLKNLEEQQKKFNEIKVAAEQIKLNIAGWKFSQDLINGFANLMSDIAKRGFDAALTDFFNNTKPIDKEQLDEIIAMEKQKNIPIVNYTDKDGKKLSKKQRSEIYLKSQNIIDEEEKKYREEQNKKKPTKIYIGDEEVKTKFKTKTKEVPNLNNTTNSDTVLGAVPVVPGGNLDKGTMPSLPSTTATTTNNNSTVNITNYWNNQFEWIKEPEDMVQAADKLADQMGLSEYTNSTNI